MDWGELWLAAIPGAFALFFLLKGGPGLVRGRLAVVNREIGNDPVSILVSPLWALSLKRVPLAETIHGWQARAVALLYLVVGLACAGVTAAVLFDLVGGV